MLLNAFPEVIPLFGISGGEILVLLLLVLILFGPSKIPEIARMLGKGVGEIRKVQREINSEIQRYSADVEQETKAMQSEIDSLRDELDVVREQAADDPRPGNGADENNRPKGSKKNHGSDQAGTIKKSE